MKNQDKTRLSYIEGSLSILVNTLLFALKLWAGIVSNSIAITADAWHTLSDSISSVVLILGAKIAKKPADKEHPFGHGRAELVSAFIIGFLLLFVGYEFIVKSYDSLINKTTSTFTTLSIVVTIISIIAKEALAQFSFWAARKTQSKALKADAWHHRSDASSSLVILIGIFIGRFYWWIDAALGFVVAGFIIYSAYEIIKDTVSTIMGVTPDEAFKKELKDYCNALTNRDLHIHHVHIHSYGDHIELTFHIRLPSEWNLVDAHSISDKLEKSLIEKYGYDPTIHVDPLNIK
ncbi:MAG: cation diffusion facilitator family transporter [Marinifilaceae bacterium]